MFGYLGSYRKGSKVDVRLAQNGLPAIEARRALGLKEEAEGIVGAYLPDYENARSERACRLWAEVLTDYADLPELGESEVAALFRAKLIRVEPCACRAEDEYYSFKPEARLRVEGSPEEIVLFRRTWAAERKAEECEILCRRLKEDTEVLKSCAVCSSCEKKECRFYPEAAEE